MDEELEFSLDTEAHQARLQFTYPSPVASLVGRLIDGVVQVAQGPLCIAYRFLCFGYDLDQFGRALRRLHTDLAGEAEFVNQEGNVQITFTVAERGRGRLAVAIDVEQPVGSGGWINLTGFVVEQSFLPGMVEAIERFLRSTGVERTHPMLRIAGQT